MADGRLGLLMRAAEYPVAPPPPLPLLPTTAGWRWPWLTGTAVLILTAGGLLLPALEMAVQIGTSSDEQYTAWVGEPRATAYFLALVVSLATFGLLCMRRWKHRTRNVMFAVCAVFGLVAGLWGVHESAARRHVGPALVAAVDSIHGPAGATASGPVVVDSDGGTPYLGELGAPQAGREWDLATDTEAAACADARAMVAGKSGWQPWGICGFRRVQGRVLVIVDVGGIRSANAIDVSASPND